VYGALMSYVRQPCQFPTAVVICLDQFLL